MSFELILLIFSLSTDAKLSYATKPLEKLVTATSDLKKDMKNDIFRSGIGPRFGELGDTSILKIPGSNPPRPTRADNSLPVTQSRFLKYDTQLSRLNNGQSNWRSSSIT